MLEKRYQQRHARPHPYEDKGRTETPRHGRRLPRRSGCWLVVSSDAAAGAATAAVEDGGDCGMRGGSLHSFFGSIQKKRDDLYRNMKHRDFQAKLSTKAWRGDLRTQPPHQGRLEPSTPFSSEPLPTSGFIICIPHRRSAAKIVDFRYHDLRKCEGQPWTEIDF
jgi:hypothetical protein